MHEKHIFALSYHDYSQVLKNQTSSNIIALTDEKLTHRIIRVLRLTIGDKIILFDNQIHSCLVIKSYDKKKLILSIEYIKSNTFHLPRINILLPILKQSHLEEAIYSLTELGASSIQLIKTEKTQIKWQDKELDRLRKIAIGAAEQSKNYIFPEIFAPISFIQACQNNYSHCFFFDPEGISPLNIILKLGNDKQTTITLLVGPAGDLTSKEKEQLQSSNFTFLHLTPTILQAHHAIALACGIFRTLL